MNTTTDHYTEALRERANAKRISNRVRIGRPCETCECGRVVEVSRKASHIRYNHKAS